MLAPAKAGAFLLQVKLCYNILVMNTLLELFIVFFKLGAFTIGGGIAMLPPPLP